MDTTVEGFGGPKEPKEGVQYKDLYEEGPWFYKRGGKYYLLYAAGGVPEHISYSMSDSPTGPWKYMGKIMPLQDTNSFTNHCGVVDFKESVLLPIIPVGFREAVVLPVRFV